MKDNDDGRILLLHLEISITGRSCLGHLNALPCTTNCPFQHHSENHWLRRPRSISRQESCYEEDRTCLFGAKHSSSNPAVGPTPRTKNGGHSRLRRLAVSHNNMPCAVLSPDDAIDTHELRA